MSRAIASKWVKQSVLQKNEAVAKHIPETCFYRHDQLQLMLDKHGMVVLKPVIGTGGGGLLRVEKNENGYLCSQGSRNVTLKSFGAVVGFVNRRRRRRRYLIQQGIHLASINGRPIDYRVKLVKLPSGKWQIRAIVGRLARRGLFVTNLCKGGELLKFAKALSGSLPEQPVADKKRELKTLSYTCVKLMEHAFPGVGELGFDFALDQSGQPWLLEVNTRPH
ncbi:YheC/YheD family protein [Paenibacillus sp. MBLB4367]|uniref:YheC/YheD family protein n=1 Tax=Paenibacillus sp. MBLB4367 TaxID=3384767 RepID=UPI0039080E4B